MGANSKSFASVLNFVIFLVTIFGRFERFLRVLY